MPLPLLSTLILQQLKRTWEGRKEGDKSCCTGDSFWGAAEGFSIMQSGSSRTSALGLESPRCWPCSVSCYGLRRVPRSGGWDSSRHFKAVGKVRSDACEGPAGAGHGRRAPERWGLSHSGSLKKQHWVHQTLPVVFSEGTLSTAVPKDCLPSFARWTPLPLHNWFPRGHHGFFVSTVSTFRNWPSYWLPFNQFYHQH